MEASEALATFIVILVSVIVVIFHHLDMRNWQNKMKILEDKILDMVNGGKK
jgi:hypothetical protein